MNQLTEDQRREAALIVAAGCDRVTAAKYVGCTETALDEAAAIDLAFGAALRRAEATCELSHMRAVQQAARDERHWRASVWWLERRLPERYAKRDADAVGRRELVRFVGAVAGAIAEAVRDEADRRRVLDRLGELAEGMTDPLGAAPSSEEGTRMSADERD